MSLSLAAVAVLLALLSAALSLGARRYPGALRVVAFPLLGLAAAAAILGGGGALLGGGTVAAQLPLGLPWLPWHLRLDALSGLLLVIIGLVLGAVSLYGPGYVREYEHGRESLPALGGFTGLFVAGMLLVVMADDAFAFMVAWELMSLSSYFLVAFQHEHPANRRAAFLYLLMAHVGALAILLGFGVLASFGGGFTFDAMRDAALPPLWAGIAFALAFTGFGMKAGLIPLHAWLPEAHPVAPSHISALMSGVMLKVAVYGLVRFTFDLLGQVHWGWGVAALVVGSASALGGVLYSLMQHDLKRLLAYSSVENVGIIFIALGLAMVFYGTDHPTLGSLGLVAALYHAVNHALFKSLLFLGAGAVLQQSHERDLERMGGLLMRMPWTGVSFLVGCLGISALPPLNGFVSEWLTFQTALQVWALDSGVLRVVIPVAAAALALTGALGAAGFVRVYGIAFLGRPRTRRARFARRASFGMRFSQALLAFLCLLFGVLAAPVVSVLSEIPRQLLGVGLPQATAHGWLWLTPVSPDTASYGAPLVLLAIAGLWLGGYLALHLGPGRRAVRRDAPWDCGFGPLSPRMQYTAGAFAMPMRRVFRPVFQIDERLEGEGGLRYRLQIADRSWALLYVPVARAVQAAARRVGRLQSGSVRAYLGYSLGTVLVLLWLIT